jgi:hypothetical protein
MSLTIDFLYDKSNVKHKELKKWVSTKTANELMELSKPCYFPPFKKEYTELLYLTGLKNTDISKFIKEFYPAKLSKELILRDNGTNILLFIIYYFLKKNDKHSALATMTYLNIKFYSSRLRVHLRVYCDPNVFRLALDSLSKNHLFVREKTISNAIYYLSNFAINKFNKILKEFDNPEKISKCVYDIRNKIAQSVRSFAQTYFKISEAGGGFKDIEEYDIDLESKTLGSSKQKIAIAVSKEITIFKKVDQKAFNSARSLTKVNYLICEFLVKSINDIKYIDDIRVILELFLNEINKKEDLCSTNFFRIVQKLMAIKKTSKPIYFKQQVTKLVCKLLQSSNSIKEKYDELTNQTKFQISSFMAFYLCLIIRNRFC